VNSRKITISGTGCALADFLYTDVAFTGPAFKKYLSGRDGDGGLCPGKLIFTEELEKFSGESFQEVLKNIVGSSEPDAFNIGGPSLVSLIHASQLLGTDKYETRYYGIAGKDETSERIFKALKDMPVDLSYYKNLGKGTTPFTYVLSDPTYNNGNGERSFINNIGTAWHYTPDMLDKSFFDSDILCFGGTALVPQIHDDLASILEKAKEKGCITVVNTVYDFRNEKANPGSPWPLGNGSNHYFIDVLIMDLEEALKISGKASSDKAITFFVSSGVSSFIITNGASDIIAYSDGKIFKPTGKPIGMPISDKVRSKLAKIPAGQRDTTGCGDNFAGGVIASLAWQLSQKLPGEFSLTEAVSWGIVSGGFACSIIGGTWFEKFPGEKRTKIHSLYNAYLNQICTK
jgi:sugar/nucleoside kinase (ribokinase family)